MEVSRFLKASDSIGMEKTRIRFYGLDRTKRSPDVIARLAEVNG